jgi:hypothetical protein
MFRGPRPRPYYPPPAVSPATIPALLPPPPPPPDGGQWDKPRHQRHQRTPPPGWSHWYRDTRVPGQRTDQVERADHDQRQLAA